MWRKRRPRAPSKRALRPRPQSASSADTVEEAINILHTRLSDLKTRQLFWATRWPYLEGTGASEDGSARIPFCVAYDLVGDRIAAMRAYGQIASLMSPAQ
jgi:hypothetical protein